MFLEDAIDLATERHRLQVDKAGKPYILHPIRVMLQMETKEQMIVAVLHDIVEDSKYPPGIELINIAGLFGVEIAEAVKAISREDKESLEDYIARVKENELAKAVKYADIADNMDPLRLAMLDEKSQKRLAKKYLKTLDLLKG
jgi:(p)ppGpp synthase/HD superfamily hydrolase